MEIQAQLRRFLEYLEIEKGRNPKTVERYRGYLQRFFDFGKIKAVGDISPERVRAFRIALNRSGVSAATQNYYLIALRQFLKYCATHDISCLNPDKIELAKTSERKIEILRDDELERLLAAPKGSDVRALRDRAILETFFSTGARISELCSLNRYDVNLDKGEFAIRGKGGGVRVVFLSERAITALHGYLKARQAVDEALFVSHTGTERKSARLSPRSVQKLVGRYARQAGIVRPMHPHIFRHQFATDLLSAGADLRAVQAMLGHKNIATTQIYTHVTNKALKEIHHKFHGKRRKA